MRLRIVYTTLLLALSSLAVAQCSPSGSGTNCMGPITITPPSGNTVQSSITFVDVGQPPPSPAPTSYILSIVSGQLQESDNNGPYHTLVGPQGQQGAQGIQGVPGPAGPAGQNGQGFQVGTVITGTLQCPPNKVGTIAKGFTTKNCTFTITALN
jgi:hypothetical protein